MDERKRVLIIDLEWALENGDEQMALEIETELREMFGYVVR